VGLAIPPGYVVIWLTSWNVTKNVNRRPPMINILKTIGVITELVK
jgi:hypothetical protein